jgi:hypothetical protein
MTTIITEDSIAIYQLMVWKSAIKLEKLGMKRRGRSALSIAKEHFGMPKRTTYDEVIARIQKEIDNAEL